MNSLSQSQLRDLLCACRLGDESAARALYEALAPSMRLFARALLSEDALGEDATQQAFLRMLRTPRDRVEGVRDPLAWLLSLVRSEAMTIRRTRKRATARDEMAMPPLDKTLEPDIAILDDAIRRLPDGHREIIVLRHACGLTFDQLAIAAALSRSAAAARYRAAVKALREEIARLRRDRAEREIDRESLDWFQRERFDSEMKRRRRVLRAIEEMRLEAAYHAELVSVRCTPAERSEAYRLALEILEGEASAESAVDRLLSDGFLNLSGVAKIPPP